MMHRDLKTANIFYLGSIDELDSLVLVLGDFGEAKVIDECNKAKTCAGTNVCDSHFNQFGLTNL
jgi:hypothetical protein